MKAEDVPEDKIAFAIAEGHDNDHIPIVVLGVSPGAWEYMKTGMAHDFDLTHIGIPVKIVVFGAPSKEEVMRLLMQGRTADTVDASKYDFSIRPKRKRHDS
jgi:hypothetical protein